MSNYLRQEAQQHAEALKELRARTRKAKDRLTLHLAARAFEQLADAIQANTAVLNAALDENNRLKGVQPWNTDSSAQA